MSKLKPQICIPQQKKLHQYELQASSPIRCRELKSGFTLKNLAVVVSKVLKTNIRLLYCRCAHTCCKRDLDFDVQHLLNYQVCDEQTT